MKNKAIGVLMTPSPNSVQAIIGVLKSGAHFVPLSNKLSVTNLQLIVKQSNIDLLLTDDLNMDTAKTIVADSKILNIDKLVFENSAVEEYIQTNDVNDNICYVVYTSGSTGVPKGIAITNKNLSPLLLWAKDYFSLGDSSKILQNLSPTFDFGIMEILTSLLSGGEYHIMENMNIVDLAAISKYINRNKINVLHTTPSFIKNLLLNDADFSSLDQIHLGGEEVSYELIDLVLQKTNEGALVYNGYGPTECTINSTIYRYSEKDLRALNAPIGGPSANNLIYILNEDLKLVPIGVIGEICIGGDGVAPGYVENKLLSEEKFVSNPFLPNTKMYRSGDLARWLPDGNIEFIGRKDEQVKIRGFRIELGEIENVLNSYEKVKSGIILPRKNSNGDKELIAFIILNVNLDIHEIHSYLSASLPNYMLPSYYVKLDEFPLTVNGKIDKNALLLLRNFELIKGNEYVAPRNDIEKKLADIWKEILEKDTVGVKDNFFELGGDSIKMMRIILAIRNIFDYEIQPSLILNNPRIEFISELVETYNLVSKPTENETEGVIIEI